MPSLRRLPDALAVLRARWYFRRAATLGPKVRAWGRPVVSVYGSGKLIIHDRARITATVARTELVAGDGGTLEIGESAFINYGCSISAQKLVRIGARSNIGTHCMIIDSDFHTLDPGRRNVAPEPRPIILGENVWLGGRVIVLPGVTIGDDSVIGAGSVVTTDIPARVVAAGVPARVIREL